LVLAGILSVTGASAAVARVEQGRKARGPAGVVARLPVVRPVIDSFITPDLRLHDVDSTLRRRLPSIDADTLGNFYVVWREGLNAGIGYEGRVVVTRIRHDGTVEPRFAVIEADTSRGFGNGIKIDVSPSGDQMAVIYTRFYDSLPSMHSARPAIPNYQYCKLQVLDSTGNTVGAELWADSVMWQQGDEAYSMAVAVTDHCLAAVWESELAATGELEHTLVQGFDLSGNRLTASPIRIDTSDEYTLLYSQRPRAASWNGGFIVTWDESVEDLGLSDQHPVFRLFDAWGTPITPVIAACYEEGYVDDCSLSAPGYQNGYFPEAACAPDGEFMLVWSTCSGQDIEAYGSKPWGQLYNSDGTPKSGLIYLADTAPHDAPDLKVAWGDDGNYYALWSDARNSCSAACYYPLDLFVQRVSPDGELFGCNYIINDVVGSVQYSPDVDIAVSRGRACIVWRDLRDYVPPMRDGEIYAQVVSLDLIGVYVHGDVNLDYHFSSADVIYLVNYVFKSGPRPLPGLDYGDVNGDCVTSSADIIYYVNYVFKGGQELRDPCSQ
jgi:hypothetical protein